MTRFAFGRARPVAKAYGRTSNSFRFDTEGGFDMRDMPEIHTVNCLYDTRTPATRSRERRKPGLVECGSVERFG